MAILLTDQGFTEVPNELYHWGIKKGGKAKNHKYIDRKMGKNGKWIYTYLYSPKKNRQYKKQAENKALNITLNEHYASRAWKTITDSRIIVDNKYDHDIKKKRKKNFIDYNKNAEDAKRQQQSVLASSQREETKKIKNRVKRLLKKAKANLVHKAPKGRKVVKNLDKTKTKQQLIDEIVKTQSNRNKEKAIEAQKQAMSRQHKYVGKIKLPNGKYRYFYDQKELEAYYRNHGTADERALMKEYSLKQSALSDDGDQASINESYDKRQTLENSNNCYSCALAYDMRRRGLDVDAILDPDGETVDNIMDCYKTADGKSAYENAKVCYVDKNGYTDKYSAKDIGNGLKRANYNDTHDNGYIASDYVEKSLKQTYPDIKEGSNGYVLLYWNYGGGHAINWTYEKGKLVFRDPQTGYVMNESATAAYLDNSRAALLVKTDDLKPNAKKVSEYLSPDSFRDDNTRDLINIEPNSKQSGYYNATKRKKED